MSHHINAAVVCLVIALCSAACGNGGGASSGGGNADTMNVIVTGPSGPASSTYSEGAFNSQGYLDPSLSSYVTASSTYVSLCSGSAGSGCDTLITISIRGAAPASYPTGTSNSPTQITYGADGLTYSSIYSGTVGTITLSGVGDTGEPVTGSFDAVVALMTDPSDTRGLSGSFSVKRDF